jgi:tetratricopeptide (TPR) repeat protein
VDGVAHLYLDSGRHTLLVGAQGRVAAFEVEVRKGRPVTLDLSRPQEWLIDGCANAVLPYLSGDVDRAADALEEAGQLEAAARMRGHAPLRGETPVPDAPRGDVSISERMLDADGDGDAPQSAGQIMEAARAYEANGDFEGAARCYRQLGDLQNVLAVLEKSDDLLGAARLALEIGDVERALHDYAQIGEQARDYAEARRAIAMILAERGDAQYALERFDEARASRRGLAEFETPMLERYAALLEAAGRGKHALAVLRALHDRQPDDEVARHIATLDAQLAKRGTGDTSRDRARDAGAAPGAEAPAAGPGRATGKDEGRYEEIGALDRGPLGERVKAVDRLGGGEVALLWLPPALARNAAAVERFVADTERAAALDHPNIVATLDAGVANDRCFHVSPLQDGASLDKLLARRGPLPPHVVAQLGVQIAAGLHFAHRRELLHLALRPANLLLGREKIVKIMGFGLGGALEVLRRSGADLPPASEPEAPERALGNADARTDMHDLGVTLYTLATGAPAASGATGPLDPRDAAPETPEALAALIRDLTAPRPEDRPARLAEVARSLQGLVDAARAARTRGPAEEPQA